VTDYYVHGDGHHLDGPYKLQVARIKAAQLADDGEDTVSILAHKETVKGLRDDELRDGYKRYLNGNND
jgi:hypothetical protein